MPKKYTETTAPQKELFKIWIPKGLTKQEKSEMAKDLLKVVKKHHKKAIRTWVYGENKK
jgi:hypothetical protein